MHVDWTIYSSLIGAGVILLLPARSKELIRWVALLTGLIGLGFGLQTYFAYDCWLHAQRELVDGFWPVVNLPWIPALGARYHLAVDGLNLPLVALNGFVCVSGILFSWNIEERVKEFFAFFLT